MVFIILIVLFALAFDFINGFHDTANAIATAVSTRALTLGKAIIMAAIMNFIGAIVSTGVAKTIAGDIIDLNIVSNGSLVIISALIGAIAWNLFTWYFGIPSSSSHALIGSLVGATLADAGVTAVKVGGFGKILISLFASPVLAMLVGFIMYKIIKFLFRRTRAARTNNIFKRVQIFTAALQAFSHGTNDAQKSMGIITMALIAADFQTGVEIQPWVKIACALAMALGTSVGGWRIIKTVGTQIMQLKPPSAVSADLASALTIQVATKFGLPVSTTHVISSSIMGVGSASRIKSVNWGTAKKMISAWFTTIPITVIISALIYFIFKFLHIA